MRKLITLSFCLLLVCLPLCAAGTTIADTIRTPFGGLWNGSIKITCPSGVNAAGQTIEEFTQSITVINGAFRVTIDPGDAGSPKGRTCSATYSSPSSSAPSGQPKTWLVPTSATPLKIPQVQTGPVPAPPAMLLLSQITSGGATLNQAMCWLGLSWGPGNCGGGGTWGSITGTLSAQSDLSTALSGKADTTDPRFTDARAPTAHVHPEADVTNLVTDLSGKVSTSDSRLSDPRTPTAHTQAASTITDFQTTVSTNSDVAATKSAQHAQGTDQGLDTGGANAVTAAQAKTAYGHSQATGNPHGTTAAQVGAEPVDANILRKDANGNVAMRATLLGPLTIGAGANQLPAAAAGNSGWLTVVTDAASGSDCTVGGGTSAALCRSNGSAWVPLGGGSSGTNTPSCTKYTVAYSALTAAATTQDVALFALPARGKITGLTIKEGTRFVGTGITALTVSLGRTGTETEYAPAWALLQAVSDTNMYDDGGHFSATFASHAVQAKFTATGANLNLMTAGSVDIWACTVVLP
jgi:hypothetical protein